MRILICILLACASVPAQKRIVSTAPAITETLFALGLGEHVVGISTYCHYPKEAATRPKIGTYLQPNVEAILRLRPDMVIIERLAAPAIEKLRSAGIRVQQITTGDVTMNLRMIEEIAAAAEVPEKGKALSLQLSTALRELESAVGSRAKRRVVFIVGRTPGRLEGMIAVGKGSYLNELIRIAGGTNVLADSLATYPKVSLEAMIRMQPDVIIDMGDMAETTGVTDEHKRSVEALWKSRKDIRASIHAVASDIFVVPGPRMVDAAREFRRLIHGDNPR